MLATDLVQLLDSAIAAARTMEAAAPSAAPAVAQALTSSAADLRRRVEIARAQAVGAAPRRLEYPAPESAPTTYIGAIEQMDERVRPIITGLLEAPLGDRLHRTIVQVDAAIGAGMAAGTEILAAGRSDDAAIRALLGHVGSAATAGLEIALTYTEAAPYRAQMRELLAAIGALRPAQKAA